MLALLPLYHFAWVASVVNGYAWKARHDGDQTSKKETSVAKHRLHTRHCIPNLLVSSSRRLDTYMLHELFCALDQLRMNIAALWECWLCCNSSNVDAHGKEEGNVCAVSAMP